LLSLLMAASYMRTGRKIYHSPSYAEQTVLHSATTPAIAVFEADGRDHKVYCQVILTLWSAGLFADRLTHIA
jgi:hypothetical protein